MERPSGPWPALRAIGTARRAIMYCSLVGDSISVLLSPGPPSGPLARTKRLVRPQASCGPCIVHWQEILSPSYYPLARPPALGTASGLLERAQRY